MSEYGIPVQNVAVDAVGLGNYFDSYLKGVVAIVANKSPMREADEMGNPILLEQYSLLRDQLYGKLSAYIAQGKLRYELDGDSYVRYGRKGEEMSLSDLLIMEAVECLKRYETERGKFFFARKKLFKERHGFSPDDLDLLAFRMVFELEATLKKETESEYRLEDYYRALYV
jgi:hypothetical protein